MTAPIRLLIHGASGRMGQALMRLCAARADCTVVAAISRSVAQRVSDGVPHFAAHEMSGVPAFDVAIDFSLPAGFDAILALCVERGAGFVSGTTGVSAAQREAIDAAARRIPLLWASNFSIGVAVLGELVRRVATLVPDWDCDIVESHHVRKLDAPSGTAVTLASAIADVRGAPPPIASLRAGDIVGEHLVQFTAHGERLELTHRATHRDLFAAGALRAAIALNGRAPQAYVLADVLFAPR